jgi:hypothetical protein
MRIARATTSKHLQEKGWEDFCFWQIKRATEQHWKSHGGSLCLLQFLYMPGGSLDFSAYSYAW